MLTWFRPGPSPHQTALAMIGAKSGDRVLVAGQPDTALVAAIAQVTGLNGQTIAAGPSEMRTGVDAAAAKAGVLVDFVVLDPASTLVVPVLAPSPDIVVLVARLAAMPPDERRSLVTAAVAAVRAGGRVIAIEGAKRSGLLKRDAGPSLPVSDVVALMTTAGAIAARALGEDAGVTYYEARRART